MPGLYDDSGIVVDPITGAVISSPATNTPGPGIGAALAGLRSAMLPPGPSASAPMPPQQPAPAATLVQPTQSPAPQQGPMVPPPDQAAQLAAVGINPDAYGQSAPQQPMPVPPIPPQQPPQIGSTDSTAQPQAPSLATPQGTSTGHAQDYSSAAPPPDALKPIVDAAAEKYGVPSQVAYWMGSHESGWDPKAVGMQTSSGKAMGAWQFMPGTAKQYGLADPTDFAASTDAAMHYISDLAKKNGGDWAAAIKQYGTFSTGMGKDRDAAAEAGFRTYMGQSPATDTMTLASTSTPASGGSGSPNDALMAALHQPTDTSVPFPNVGQPDRRQQLLAVAAGLLQGKSFGQGLGKGLENLVGVNNTTQSQQMQANQQAVEKARLLQQQNYQNVMAQVATGKLGLAANKPAGPPVMGVGEDGKPVAMIRLGDGSTVPLPGVTPQMLNAGTAQQRLALAQDTSREKLDLAKRAQDLKNDPTQLARLTQEKVAATSAQKDQDAVYSSQSQDQQGLQDINEAQSLIAQKPDLMGPTLANRWARWSASIGLSGEASDLNALQKMTADQRNTFLSTLTNGHVGGIRSNAELKNLSQAVADVGTSPEAANYILNLQKSQLLSKDAWRQELTARSQTDPDSIAGRQYNVTKNQFFDDYWKQHPLPSYSSPSGTSSPAPSAASGAPSGTPPGVSRVLRYDAKGNLVQ